MRDRGRLREIEGGSRGGERREREREKEETMVIVF